MQENRIISRRKAIITGLASLGGILMPGCSTPSVPTYGSILRMGDLLTYKSQRGILPAKSLAREYSYSDISSFPATGTTNPADSDSKSSEEYARLQHGLFNDWRLIVDGKVNRPGSFSLDDLKSFSSRTQITRHTCEEGWSAIGQWTGVQLGRLLDYVGIMESAQFVYFYSYDGAQASIDMIDALHPQTLLAYGMNGKDLPVPHGAPVRLRVERQIGYKSLKFLQRIQVTDHFLKGQNSGWAWYTGI